MAFDPTSADLDTFTGIADIFGWLEMGENLVEALTAATGAGSMSLRVWARIPAARWATLATNLKVDNDTGEARDLTPVEEGQVGDVHHILQLMAARGPSPATGGQAGAGANQGGVGGTGGAANIIEQAAAGAAGA